VFVVTKNVDSPLDFPKTITPLIDPGKSNLNGIYSRLTQFVSSGFLFTYEYEV